MTTDASDLGALRALQGYRPPRALPASARIAWGLYASAGDRLTDEGLEDLRILLGRYEDLRSLTDALCGLAAFQTYVGETLGDEEAASRVGRLIQEMGPRYVPFFEQVMRAVEALGGDARRVLGRLFGREPAGEKRAPLHDAAAPQGTVPLRTLRPAAEPPPWARRVKPR